jgi:uncharacterized protein (UPF0332 family)
MPLAEELLEHARFLANLDPRTTSQAHIRRAVSAAYYAVFHLLAAEVAEQVSPDSPAGLRERTQRALEHTHMGKVAKAFSQQGVTRVKDLPDDVVLPHPVSQGLALIGGRFKRLQDERHAADYDVSKKFDPADALTQVQEAEEVFKDWAVEKSSSNARVFLASLMFGKSWNR